MKAIVISDTHLKSPEKLSWLQQAGDSVIIHAGDYTDPSVVAFLQQSQLFFGVYGNADSDLVKTMLPERQQFTLGPYQVGLYHGHGTGQTTAERAFAAFADDQVDIIVFGHSHQPSISTRNHIIMLNPGSATAKRKERWFSYIELELTPNGVKACLHLASTDKENIDEIRSLTSDSMDAASGCK